MISRLFLATSLALFAASANAQPVPAAAPAITIPPNKCVKPEYPGKLASATRFTAFNKEYTAYGECIKKYVDDTKIILNAAVAAVNGAVEEFNKFAADIKSQDEAAKN